MSAPSLKDVTEKIYEARTKWRALLLQLDVQKHTLDAIGVKWRDNPDDCLREGLSEWLNGGERSWRDVVEALSSPSVGYKNLADKVENYYLHLIDEPAVLHEQQQDVKKEASQQTISDDLKINTNDRLGDGGTGVVFKGVYRGSPCAVKVLHHLGTAMTTGLPAGKGQIEAVKKFRSECEFLKSFKHPNVVEHLTTARHPQSGHNILVTELMDCNLSSYLPNSAGSLSTDGEISISKDIAMGLAYIHSRKIVHRDLCGDNILLKMTNPVPLAKISDFGMSKLIDPSVYGLTALNHRQGYMPPEAARSAGERYDGKIDMFSLGVIMVQIVSRISNVKDLKERVQFHQGVPLSHPLRGIIDDCLSEESRKRPSAEDLVKLFQGYLQSGATKVNSREDLPFGTGELQSAVVDGIVFVGGGTADSLSDSCTVLAYQRGEWTRLPEYSAQHFSMTSYNNQLALIGGENLKTKKKANEVSLFSEGKWTPFGKIVINRSHASAVSFLDRMIVAGGIGHGEKILATVEVYDAARKKWRLVQPLPKPLYLMKPVIIDDTLYLLGGKDENRDSTKIVLSSNLSGLSSFKTTNEARPRPSSASSISFSQLPRDLPYHGSSPICNKGSLLAVGGHDQRGKESSSVYHLKSDTDSWVKLAGELPAPRHSCTCSVLPNGKIIVVGGLAGDRSINSVDFLSL